MDKENKYIKVTYRSKPIGKEGIVLELTTFDTEKWKNDKQFDNVPGKINIDGNLFKIISEDHRYIVLDFFPWNYAEKIETIEKIRYKLELLDLDLYDSIPPIIKIGNKKFYKSDINDIDQKYFYLIEA